MGHALQDMTVVVVGRGSGIARAVTLQARSEGARVIDAGATRPNSPTPTMTPTSPAEVVDVTDDTSIATSPIVWAPSITMVSTASAPRAGKACRAGTQESAGVVQHEGSSAPPCWPNTLARIRVQVGRSCCSRV